MDDTLVEKYEHAGCTVEIHYDRDPESPREWDNVSVMVCEHRRYTLGDKTGRNEAKMAVLHSRDYRPSWDEGWDAQYDFDDPPQLWAAVQRCKDIFSLPLYLYDHSGITMNTGGFHCPWDSGQVGFIFVTRERALEEWFPGKKKLSPQMKETIYKYLKQEVATYDEYLTGEVYGYIVKRGEDDDEESCWGFYGGLDYIKQEANSIAEYMEKQALPLLAEANLLEVVNGDKETDTSSRAT